MSDDDDPYAGTNLITFRGQVGYTCGPRGSHAVQLQAPLFAGERGLIVSPPLVKQGGQLAGTTNFDLQELQFSLLLWDRLEYPTNTGFSMGITDPHAWWLMNNGILQRSMIQLEGTWATGDDKLEEQRAAYYALEAREPNRWAVAHGERSLSVFTESNAKEYGIAFELHRALAVPDKTVPFDVVLDFKARHSAELQTLRSALDGLYGAVAENPNPTDKLASEIRRLDAAAADHLRIAREWRFPLKLVSPKMKVDYKTFTGAAGAFTGAAQYGLPLVAQLLAGVAGAVGFSVSADVARNRQTQTVFPFEYVTRFHRLM